MYPYLPLSEIDLDVPLGRRLPRHLAYYHLALPVAEDENGITVALAQPDNRTVRQVIEAAIGSAIVPVQSSDTEIKAALDRIWEGAEAASGGVWMWAEDASKRAALATFVAQTVTGAYAHLSIQTSDAAMVDGMLDTARAANAALIVAHAEMPETRRTLLLNAPAAIWLTRELSQPPARLLSVLRGNIPDRQLLDWLPPLIHHQNAQTVLLAAAEPASTASGSPLFSRFTSLLTPDDPRGAHLAELRRALVDLGVAGRLHVREGTLAEVMIAEITETPYDLLVMAAEASGTFAAEVFERLWSRLGGALLIKAG
jgi:hypothetical protein